MYVLDAAGAEAGMEERAAGGRPRPTHPADVHWRERTQLSFDTYMYMYNTIYMYVKLYTVYYYTKPSQYKC